MTPPQKSPPPRGTPAWRGRRARSIAWQAVLVVAIALVAGFLIHNTLANMRARGIQSGFGFLLQPAGFAIGESLFEFDSGDPYWKAFAAGLANTLRAAITGIVLCTVLGILIGIGRVSRNALVRGLCSAYVEAFRNVPVLLQLLVWYLLLTDWLPDLSAAMQLAPGVLLSKNGLTYPLPIWEAGHALTLIGALGGAIVAWRRDARARRHFAQTGEARPRAWPALGLVAAGTLAGWLAGGRPLAFDMPVTGELNITGGGSVTPEFLAVTIGLALYTAAFVAEAVRGGIQSVPHGQVEAAGALGLSRAQALRLVILPQALRVTLPPLTNQYLNLTKNSSLAVAVGYPDLVSVANTTLNQSGRAVECIAVIMAVYLALSLLTAALMHAWEARSRLQER